MRQDIFLTAVLGLGYEPLLKLAKSNPFVNKVLIPRSALAWVRACPEKTEVPGFPGSKLEKSEDIYLKIDIEGTLSEFRGSAEFISAAISVALGQKEVYLSKSKDMARIGHTIDSLVTARRVVEKATTITLTKSQGSCSCPVCGEQQIKQDVFVGCYCFRDIAKEVEVIGSDQEYLLKMGKSWDKDALEALISRCG